MNVKRCRSCGVELPIEEFYPHERGQYGVMGSCKTCSAGMARGRRGRAREIRDEALQEGCVLCGERTPVCLCFHHVEPAGKTERVSILMRHGELELLEAELKKPLLVLCHNCHAKVHAGQIKV